MTPIGLVIIFANKIKDGTMKVSIIALAANLMPVMTMTIISRTMALGVMFTESKVMLKPTNYLVHGNHATTLVMAYTLKLTTHLTNAMP